ncbi:cupin [Cyanobacteria bacterium FACHB-63]|nr:cupin [Cyanobacteria bacterium FACHB-63]
MKALDWIVADGLCETRPSAREWDLIEEHYYLHRFLTEVIDLLAQVRNEADEWDHLPQLRRLVRKLITNSYYVRTQRLEPCPKTGSSVLTLYDEIGYPLTVQNVTFAPGIVSPIHNHGTWGITAVLKGQEKHTFWRRSGDPDYPNKLEWIGQKVVAPGEVVSFTPDAIHCVEAISDEPTLTFQIYGDTQPQSRFFFERDTHTAKPF